MQTKALDMVIQHLSNTFQFDHKETEKLLKMLRRTLGESVPNLRSSDTERVYQQAHKLHSELHSCGYDRLSDLAESIERQAKAGAVGETLIDEFLVQASDFASEIDRWLVANG
jgi:HPt (histidine-containing phosphotransfer) domain-containing protein